MTILGIPVVLTEQHLLSFADKLSVTTAHNQPGQMTDSGGNGELRELFPAKPQRLNKAGFHGT